MDMLGKILLVDDEADFLESLRSILVSEGYEVVCAGTGTKAMHMVREERPDLVLTDILMPDLSGLQLARNIRQVEGEDFPIITMTGYPPTDDLTIAGREQGLFNIALTKPVQIPDLLSAVNLCLENR